MSTRGRPSFPTHGRCLIGVAVAATSCAADAHELLLRYELPIPFRLYVYACAATLVVTFALFGWFLRSPVATSAGVGRPRARSPFATLSKGWLTTLRVAALACLGATIVAGFFGTKDPDWNIAPALFWEIFLLGFVYWTAVAGNVFAYVNPWKFVADGFAAGSSPPFAYPTRLAYWPAVAFYVALVWIELFIQPRPGTLAWLLTAYSAITFAGMRLFGQTAWLRHGEMFDVLFRVVGLLSPIDYRPGRDNRSVDLYLRRPFAGLVAFEADSLSLVTFVLAILALTTYDGIHQTVLWMGLFWNGLLPLFEPTWQLHLQAGQATWERWFVAYQWLGLVLAPFVYLAIYLGILGIARLVTQTTLSVRRLALAFVFTIVPIAVVYNVAHYYTFILTKAPLLPVLFLRPFGWNPLGLVGETEPPILDMAGVWHVEVALILVGHLVGVYVAHRVALRLFGTPRQAVTSQVPMLLLMMAYTVAGLWVISLPFALT